MKGKAATMEPVRHGADRPGADGAESLRAERCVCAGRKRLDLLLIVLMAPFLLLPVVLVALWVRMMAGRGVVFRQTRIGCHGQAFEILKFRTMHWGTDSAVHEAHVAGLMKSDGPMVKLDEAGDDRLIPGGRFLRMTGLDELPQLVNVWRGEMSLVGPRPCLPSEYDVYTDQQRERCEVLPGLTGCWQVHGKNRISFSEMVAWDIHYVRHHSCLLDLAVILRTPGAILSEIVASMWHGREEFDDGIPERKPPNLR